jgi:hypothetical protein
MLVADSTIALALNAELRDIIPRFRLRHTLKDRLAGHNRKALIGGIENV